MLMKYNILLLQFTGRQSISSPASKESLCARCHDIGNTEAPCAGSALPLGSTDSDTEVGDFKAL
jgi:hypothetical protein